MDIVKSSVERVVEQLVVKLTCFIFLLTKRGLNDALHGSKNEQVISQLVKVFSGKL